MLSAEILKKIWSHDIVILLKINLSQCSVKLGYLIKIASIRKKIWLNLSRKLVIKVKSGENGNWNIKIWRRTKIKITTCF